jgi:hypothetical protein
MLEEAKDQSHISLEEDRQSLKKKERWNGRPEANYIRIKQREKCELWISVTARWQRK